MRTAGYCMEFFNNNYKNVVRMCATSNNFQGEWNLTTTPCIVNSTKEDLIEQFKRNWQVKVWINRGFFTEGYIYDINVHWLQFKPPDSSKFYILGALYLVIMVFGMVGNGLVIFLFCRCKSLRTLANTLVVNLAVSDCLILLKMPVFIYNCYYQGPVLGDFACRLYGFIGGLSGTASIGSLTAISFDRYYVIRYPLKRYSKGRIYVCLVFSWIYALIFSLIPFLDIGFGKYQYEGYLISCSFDYLSEDEAERAFILVFFVGAFVVPVLAIGFSYYKILQVVGSRSEAVSGKKDSFRHVEAQDKRKQETKLALIVLVVIFLWFFSWSPYATVSLLGIFGQKHLITPLSSMIPALFCKSTSAIDPYVYAISHPKFREEIRKLLGLNKPKKGNLKKTEMKQRIWTTEKFSKSSKSLVSTGSTFAEDNDDVEELSIELDLHDIDLAVYAYHSNVETEEDRLKQRELIREASRANLFRLNSGVYAKKTSKSRFQHLSKGFSGRQTHVEETMH
ncbi:opsin, ultraviolet-sensitive-like [Anthonomus grandis grandis]|uniref:opsin, ultraviolet-sensitive-like n=1 Tax=Anthonomus grandis grandis TaxID=2921223 RepID=UPI002165FB9F|nr:opsin, ultraviolet-sensitive-like [Anthonomus grandis grandis]